MKTTHLTGGRAARALPLAGVCAAVVTVAGYMTIGPKTRTAMRARRRTCATTRPTTRTSLSPGSC